MNIMRLIQRFTQFAAVMVFSAMIVGNAGAQDIFVDSSGGSNTACNGTSPNVANIPNCPFQFLDFALTQAADGDVIEVAAGVYPNGPFVFGQGGNELTIQARNVNANDSVILVGLVDIQENTTFLNAGTAGTGFFANGGVKLTANTMSVDLPATFNIPSTKTIERLDGDMDGGVTNNAPPTFAAVTNLTYTSTTVGIDLVGGNEVPASLGTGTLVINMTGGGTSTLIFPTSFIAGATTISGSNTANVTWSGTLTATSVTINDANTHAFGGASVTGGDFLMTAGSTVSTGDLATNGNRLLQINAAGGSFTSTGTVSNSTFASNNGVLGDGGGAAWIVHDGATMILNDIDLSFATVGDGDGASTTHVNTIQKLSGDLTITGTITEAFFTDTVVTPENDNSFIEIIVEGGIFAISQSNTISGLVTNRATLRFMNGGTLNGDVDNLLATGTIFIGAGTLDLTLNAGAFTELSTFTGPGALLLSGDADIDGLSDTTGLTTGGNLTLAGDNDLIGSADLTVGGALLVSDTANFLTGGGSVAVSGDATFSGTLDGLGLGVPNPLTVTGGNVVFASTNTPGDLTNSITITGGDLTVNSNADLDGVVSVGGTTNLNGNNDIGNGDADTFNTGDDLVVAALTTVSQLKVKTSSVGGVLRVLTGATFSFTASDSTLWTVDEVDIFQQTGGGSADGSVVLAAANQLTVQGPFSGGFFDGTGAGSILRFEMQGSGSVFAPGPNTQLCDFEAFGNELVLTVTVSFEVQCDVDIQDDSTVNLTNILMRLTGTDITLSIANDATLTATPGFGAVSFEGVDGNADGFAAVIAPIGSPTITSMIVNTVGSKDVTTTGNLTIDGSMSLVQGGFTTGANTLTFTGVNAEIIINSDGTDTDINTTGGAITGNWSLTVNGVTGTTPALGAELDPTRVINLAINTVTTTPLVGTGTTISISGNFIVTVGSSASINQPLTVAGQGSIAGTTLGVSPLVFSSVDARTHTISGATTIHLTTFATDATVTGGGSMGPTTIGAAVTIALLDHFTGLLTVGTGASLDLSLVNIPTGVGFTGSDDVFDDGTTMGISTLGTGLLTLSTQVSNVGGGVDIGNGIAGAMLDMAGNNLRLFNGSAFTADFGADLGTTGTLMTGSTLSPDPASTLDTNIGGTTNPADLVNLTINGAASIPGGVEVVGVTDVNAILSGAGFLTVSGTVHQGAFVTAAAVNITGTTWNVEGAAQTIGGTLTINATSVNFEEVNGGTQSTLTITGLYTQTAGDITYNNVHLFLATGLTYAAGTFTAGDATDQIIFDSATFASAGAEVSIENVTVSSGALFIGSTTNDHLLVRDHLTMTTGILIGAAAPACLTPGTLTLGDGAAAIRVDANGGNVTNSTCGTFAYGTEPLTLAYGGTSPTGGEFPTAPFFELEINGVVVLSPGDSPTVDLLDLNAGTVSTGIAESISISDGGTVAHGRGGTASILISVGNAPLTPLGGWTLDYDAAGGGGVSGGTINEWPIGVGVANPDLVISSPLGITTVPALPVRTVGNLTVAPLATLALGGVGINVTGDLTIPGAVTSTGGALGITGTTPQLTTAALGSAGVPLPIVLMANPTGLTLGGPMWIGVTLTLTSGAIHTGAFAVNLPHGGTGAQGFTQTGGMVVGNVTKPFLGGGVGTPADRVTFPTGTADGLSYRPASITFNNPSAVAGLASGLTVTVAHVETSIGGSNNMPLTTLDGAGQALTIARYPDFHWSVTTSAGLSPSADYDMELNAAGFNDFGINNEKIQRVRMIRRQAEVVFPGGSPNNFLLLIGPDPFQNDNFQISPSNPIAVVRSAVGALIAAPGALFTIGLESNLVFDTPAAVVINNGGTFDIDLATLLTGGTGVFSFSDASGDTGIAATGVAGTVLTVTGTGVGSTVVTVTAADALNDSRTVSIAVTVNGAFVAGSIADAVLNVGGANSTHDVDLTTIFSGGTPPAGYVITVDDPAVATAAVAGDILTVTAVGEGATNINVAGTDASGGMADTDFTVTVNAAISAAVIADEDLRENEETTVDLTAVFGGGDGNYTFDVASASDANVTASETGGILTVTVVEAYAAGTTIGTVTVTITATDGIGDTVDATIVIDVLPVIGDLDGSGGPSPASAGITLDFFLRLNVTLTAKQIDAADMDRDGQVIPFDAALNFQAFFLSKGEIAEYVSTEVEFGEVSNESNLVTVPIIVTGGDLSEVVSLRLDSQIDPALATVVGVESKLGEGWLVRHTVSEEGLLRLAIAGHGEMTPDGVVATITLLLTDGASALSLTAEAAVNKNPVSSLDGVEVVEIPDTFVLDGNYPNPFNPSTTIQFNLPERADVEIQVFDMLGRRVMAIPARSIQAGANRSIQLNASQLASGSYLYRVIARMDSKTQVEQGRMLLLK